MSRIATATAAATPALPAAEGSDRPASAAVRAGRWWVRGIVTVLAGIVALNMWVIRLAASDGGVNAEPDYYRKAVTWDAQQARAAASAALGWRAEGAFAARVGDAAVLRLALVDRDGAPVAGATVTVHVRWNGDATHVVSGTAVARDGGYVVALPLERAGLHEVQVEAVRGADRFGTTLRLERPAR